MEIIEIQSKINTIRGVDDIVVVNTYLEKASDTSNRRTRFVEYYFLEDVECEIFTRSFKHFSEKNPQYGQTKKGNLHSVKYTKESFNRLLLEIKPDVELIGEYTNKFTKTQFRNNKCGHIFENTPHTMHLKNTVCPICSISSYGELRVREWLLKNNISFEEQKTFEKMEYVYRLRLDFYLSSMNKAIEFQGRQHFENTDSKFRDSETYEVIKGRDDAKLKYCNDNKIELLYLDYTMIEKGYLNNVAIALLSKFCNIKNKI